MQSSRYLTTDSDRDSIIFVHGLGSNPDTTWRATKPATATDKPEEAATDSERFVNWVSDFLPGDILPAAGSSDVRIFFYNYDSYWKRDALYTRLTHLGNELLEHINGEIHTSETVSTERKFDFGVLLTRSGPRSGAET